MKLRHPELADLLQKAYSAEKAAAFAYQGHAGSVKDPEQKAAIRQIELDEWNHRREVLEMMPKRRNYIPPYRASLYVTISNFLFFLINLFNVTKSFSNPWVRPAIFKKLSQRACSPAL